MSIKDGITADFRYEQDSLLSLNPGIPFITSQIFLRRFRGMSFEYCGDGLHSLQWSPLRESYYFGLKVL
jgi:hypothetical protein